MSNRATTNVIASSKKQDASLLSKITNHFTPIPSNNSGDISLSTTHLWFSTRFFNSVMSIYRHDMYKLFSQQNSCDKLTKA